MEEASQSAGTNGRMDDWKFCLMNCVLIKKKT